MGAQFCPHLDFELLPLEPSENTFLLASAAWLVVTYSSLKKQGHPPSILGIPPGCPNPQGHHRCHTNPRHQAPPSTLCSKHVPQNPLQPTPFRRGGKVRLGARQHSPDRTQQAMAGGWNLSPCVHSTALLPPPTPPSLASQGAELSFPGKGRAGWEVHVGVPLGAKPWLSGQGRSAGIVDSWLVVPGTSKKWGSLA